MGVECTYFRNRDFQSATELYQTEDLSALAIQEDQFMIRILSVGCDPHLMEVRTMVLHEAGYEVDEANSRGQAMRCLRSAKFHLVLICHTIPEPEKDKLTAAVRRLQPGLPVVCISSYGYTSPDEHCETVNNVAPAFLTDLSTVLRRAGARRI